MKRLLFIGLLFIALPVDAQFTGTDSLRNYNNRYITTNPATAFTNNRLNTLLRGIIDFIDTARAGGGGAIALGIDTLFAVNDSTIRYRKNGVFRQFVMNGVYDSRRKVDTIFKSNDTTLTFTVNGNLRTVIIPGGTNLNLATSNQTATGNRNHNWDDYWLYINNVKSFDINTDHADPNHTNNRYKARLFTDSTADGDPLRLLWGLRNINDDLQDSVHFELGSTSTRTRIYHSALDSTKVVVIDLNAGVTTPDLQVNVKNVSKNSSFTLGQTAIFNPADSLEIKAIPAADADSLLGARAINGSVNTIVKIPSSVMRARFGLEDLTATGTRTFDANGNSFNIDSTFIYKITTKTKSSGVDKGLYNRLEMDDGNIYLMVTPSSGPSPRSYGFSAHNVLTQMFARGHVSGNDGYVQADTTQVLLESDPNRLEVRHDSVTLSNINLGQIDFRIRTLPETVDTSYKSLVSGPKGQVFLRSGGNGGGGSGISGLTAGRVTLSTSGTTVGDDAGLTYNAANNKITTDSINILKARSDAFSLNWGFKADSVNAFGNSITYGANASPVDSAYPNRIADTLNVTLHNHAVAGTGIYAITASALSVMSVMHNGVTIFNGGFNTLRNNNILSGLSGRKTQNAIIWGYKSAFANHFLKSYVGVSDASVTRTGTWFTNWDATAATGKATNGAFSMSTGAYYEYTFTDSTVVIGLIGQNDLVQAGSDYTISIDGSPVITGTTSDKADGIYDGYADNGNHIAMAEIVTGLTYASHTVKVENTGSGVFIADYIGHLRPARNSPQLLMYQIPYMKGAGYVGGASSIARTDTMNLRLDSLYTTFPTAYKDYAHLLETKTLYDTATGTDSDNIHPNNTGHGQLAQLAYPYILASSFDPGSLYATSNGLYYKDATSDYKVLLGEGTTGYLPIFNATNKQVNSIVQSDGTNVGIGQTPGTYKLSVTGSLRSTADALFATSSGSVGIGLTSPSYKLDVNGTGNFQGSVVSRGSAAGFSLESRSSASYAWSIYADNDALKFLAVPGNYDRVKVWSRGGITLGHATEVSVLDMGATLDVHGSVRIDKDSVGYASGSNEQALYIDTLTGKVMRGTSAGGSLSGSGTSGRIAYWNGASSLTSNSNFLFNGSVFSTGTTNTQGQLNIGGNKDLTSSGAQQYNAAATYTDQITASSGTASSYSINLFAQPTIAAANSSVTFPTITNLYVDAPAAGTNATITNKYAIQTGTAGHVRIQGKLYLTDRDSSATPANIAWIDPNTDQLKVGPYQRTLKGTTNWTPGVVSAGSSTSTSFTVTGAAVGDPVTISKLAAYSNGEIYDAFVSATNTVTIRVHNVSTGSANYSSAADYNVVVLKY